MTSRCFLPNECLRVLGPNRNREHDVLDKDLAVPRVSGVSAFFDGPDRARAVLIVDGEEEDELGQLVIG